MARAPGFCNQLGSWRNIITPRIPKRGVMLELGLVRVFPHSEEQLKHLAFYFFLFDMDITITLDKPNALLKIVSIHTNFQHLSMGSFKKKIITVTVMAHLQAVGHFGGMTLQWKKFSCPLAKSMKCCRLVLKQNASLQGWWYWSLVYILVEYC